MGKKFSRGQSVIHGVYGFGLVKSYKRNNRVKVMFNTPEIRKYKNLIVSESELVDFEEHLRSLRR